MVERVAAGGPTYTHILRSKDVIADVLPPPEYIIEAHLVAHRALATSAGSDRRALAETLVADVVRASRSSASSEIRAHRLAEAAAIGLA